MVGTRQGVVWCRQEAQEHGNTGEANVMENIELKVEGKKLILTVDLTKEIGPSSSGKNTLIASSEGNADVPGFKGLMVGLYVYRAKPPGPALRLASTPQTKISPRLSEGAGGPSTQTPHDGTELSARSRHAVERDRAPGAGYYRRVGNGYETGTRARR
jgi:hypothetical protein